jgi:hypothetical protein
LLQTMVALLTRVTAALVIAKDKDTGC